MEQLVRLPLARVRFARLRSWLRALWLAGSWSCWVGVGACSPSGSPEPTDAGTPCSVGGCRLTCAPEDTWQVLTASSAGAPELVHVGDPEIASAAEVGDGQFHLFVGVPHPDLDPPPGVLLHEAVAADLDGPYRLSPAALSEALDTDDRYGMETPAYLRADEHREYVFYCGIYRSYQEGARGRLAALRRIDRGTWTKIGPVAPGKADEVSQCEPAVTFDPATGQFVLLYLWSTEPAAGPSAYGVSARTSTNPELFPPENESILLQDDPDLPARLTLARDPLAEVWRFAWDVGYPSARLTLQSWSHTSVPDLPELVANLGQIHEGSHDLHPQIHLDATQHPGSIGAPTRPVFSGADGVVFFYGAIGTDLEMRVNLQHCQRSE